MKLQDKVIFKVSRLEDGSWRMVGELGFYSTAALIYDSRESVYRKMLAEAIVQQIYGSLRGKFARLVHLANICIHDKYSTESNYRELNNAVGEIEKILDGELL